MNRLDIWINDSNNSELSWISICESLITIHEIWKTLVPIPGLFHRSKTWQRNLVKKQILREMCLIKLNYIFKAYLVYQLSDKLNTKSRL